MIFYVYEHWRLDRDECFYVGKGKGYRAYERKGRNRHWHNIVNKLSRTGHAYEVRIVASGLAEDEALRIEIERISFWRDIVDLANITDGGEGCSGMIHSAETRDKIKENTPVRSGKDHPMFGRKRPDTVEMNKKRSGHTPWNKGKKMSEETRLKLSASLIGRISWNKGKKFSDESRAKMSEAAKKRAPRTEETRNKLSERAKEQWAKSRSLRYDDAFIIAPKHEPSTALVDLNSYPTFETLSILRDRSKKDW